MKRVLVPMGLLLLVILGAMGIFRIASAQAASRGADPYMEHFEVECSPNHCIRWNLYTGESWVLACPGATKSCDWDPIDVRVE